MTTKKCAVCSFCGTDESRVNKMIGGEKQEGQYAAIICSDCVSIAWDILQKPDTPQADSAMTTPQDIFDGLSRYVVGQDDAKRTLSVAAYTHLKRREMSKKAGASEDHLPQKSNVLMLGPTGCGKTLLAKTLAKIIDVTFVTVDATRYTEAGYVGDDVEDIIQDLMSAANGVSADAEWGIVYVDEFDKLSRAASSALVSGRDVSGEGVQQALLKMTEGFVTSAGKKGRGGMLGNNSLSIDTSNILFIFGGAFAGLESIIARRLGSNAIGFTSARLRTKAESGQIRHVEPKDIIEYGFLPELVGRMPVITCIDAISESDMIRILTEPADAITKQFEALYLAHGVRLVFEPSALKAIAKTAKDRGTGSRGLRAIIERALLDTTFDLPRIPKGSSVHLKKLDRVDIVNPQVAKVA